MSNGQKNAARRSEAMSLQERYSISQRELATMASAIGEVLDNMRTIDGGDDYAVPEFVIERLRKALSETTNANDADCPETPKGEHYGYRVRVAGRANDYVHTAQYPSMLPSVLEKVREHQRQYGGTITELWRVDRPFVDADSTPTGGEEHG